MPGEFATPLTGRYVELAMMLLPFKKFCEGLNEEEKIIFPKRKILDVNMFEDVNYNGVQRS